MKNISRAVPRVDAPQKAGGYAQYISDIHFEGILYAETCRSSRARAIIKSISIPPVPEGYCLVDRNDVPGINSVKMLVNDQPFFAEERVNYIGEPILLVVGPEKETIEDIIAKIEIGYEDLDAVFNLQESEKGDLIIYGTDNRIVRYEVNKGEPEEAFLSAGRTFEGEYKTGLQEHVYIEPQGVVALFENGRIAVYGSMQCPYYVKRALVQGLGWDTDRIRVVQTTTGGAFGGKEEYTSIIAGHAAFAAVKTSRPVQIIFQRDEDIRCTTKRHPSTIHIRSALDPDGMVAAMDIDIKLDGGAYAGLSSVVLQRAMFAATGVYDIPNIRVKGSVWSTNNVPAGAFRGFGGPQAFFAVETHMQELAEHIDENPFDFKMRHVIEKGGHTVTGGVLREDVQLKRMVDILDGMSGFRKKYTSFPMTDGEKRRGVGLSLFFHGCAFTGSGEKDIIKAKVKLKKYRDGNVEILVSNVEMGQGPQTTLRKIVAGALGIPLGKVIFENPDTDRVPDSGPTVASRTVLIVGYLLQEAARALKGLYQKDDEVEVVREYTQPPAIQWNQDSLKGDAYPVYSWGANVVEVEVDPVTLVPTVTGVWGVYDVGTPIDEKIIRGQIEGGMVQGLGYASIENMESIGGEIRQCSLTDYIIPTSVDFPAMKIELVDSSYEFGPFGAKCAGELPFVGAAPAFASAVGHALGIRVRKIPVTPEYLMEVTDDADSVCAQQ
jgi:CO/xanthine dehydrogenase Mo-binding subunit